MPFDDSKPLLVQSDGTVLLDERHARYEEAAAALGEWAELHKRPGQWHTYRMTPFTLWNAAASGWTSEAVLERLRSLSRYGVPASWEHKLRGYMDAYGRLKLVSDGEGLKLLAAEPGLLKTVTNIGALAAAWLKPSGDRAIRIRPETRGWLKRELAAKGFPVVDEAGYRAGEALDLAFRDAGSNGKPIRLRDYQSEAAAAFLHGKDGTGGSGVVVLPCGAGKTWVGMAVMAALRCETLILTPNTVSVTQWVRELLQNTTLTEADIGVYTGETKRVRPVTVATYQVLTHRKAKEESNPHWKLFGERNWGLIVYDEVHLLPAPVFRMTADLQATRRLGLTATLVREDGREGDVFALIGPKKYELPWLRLENEGWIAKATCRELRVPMDETAASAYTSAPKRSRHRIAGENPMKAEFVRRLLSRHESEPTLIIGQYLDQLRGIAESLSLPVITGSTPQPERRRLFDRFNRGELRALVVSKVANFAVDLPEASVAIQISGSFGSRQEEAQRLGRILRPKRSQAEAHFYTLVSEGTEEVEFARRRQRFLLEQGYRYEIESYVGVAVERKEGAGR
ncbi:DNA repair helicase XPB [Cohnella laeviribosi]|uniref:DNA repair helicase XPB n=1 Tax=Cohnella laeviribosi TaxID=380174 RepID=UPI00035CB11A|nr:DNA repair helicase XPB [Cohnella laeviribosi]